MALFNAFYLSLSLFILFRGGGGERFLQLWSLYTIHIRSPLVNVYTYSTLSRRTPPSQFLLADKQLENDL